MAAPERRLAAFGFGSNGASSSTGFAFAFSAAGRPATSGTEDDYMIATSRSTGSSAAGNALSGLRSELGSQYLQAQRNWPGRARSPPKPEAPAKPPIVSPGAMAILRSTQQQAGPGRGVGKRSSSLMSFREEMEEATQLGEARAQAKRLIREVHSINDAFREGEMAAMAGEWNDAKEKEAAATDRERDAWLKAVKADPMRPRVRAGHDSDPDSDRDLETLLEHHGLRGCISPAKPSGAGKQTGGFPRQPRKAPADPQAVPGAAKGRGPRQRRGRGRSSARRDSLVLADELASKYGRGSMVWCKDLLNDPPAASRRSRSRGSHRSAPAGSPAKPPPPSSGKTSPIVLPRTSGLSDHPAAVRSTRPRSNRSSLRGLAPMDEPLPENLAAGDPAASRQGRAESARSTGAGTSLLGKESRAPGETRNLMDEGRLPPPPPRSRQPTGQAASAKLPAPQPPPDREARRSWASDGRAAGQDALARASSPAAAGGAYFRPHGSPVRAADKVTSAESSFLASGMPAVVPMPETTDTNHRPAYGPRKVGRPEQVGMQRLAAAGSAVVANSTFTYGSPSRVREPLRMSRPRAIARHLALSPLAPSLQRRRVAPVRRAVPATKARKPIRGPQSTKRRPPSPGAVDAFDSLARTGSILDASSIFDPSAYP